MAGQEPRFLEVFIGLYRLGVGAGIEELLRRIYLGFLRYFVHGLQGVSSKVSKVLSLGFPRYFIGGFPQGLIKDFKGIIAGISCKVYPGCPRLTGVFIQALRFPRCLGF